MRALLTVLARRHILGSTPSACAWCAGPHAAAEQGFSTTLCSAETPCGHCKYIFSRVQEAFAETRFRVCRKHKMCMDAGYVVGGAVHLRKLAGAQEPDAGCGLPNPNLHRIQAFRHPQARGVHCKLAVGETCHSPSLYLLRKRDKLGCIFAG